MPSSFGGRGGGNLCLGRISVLSGFLWAKPAVNVASGSSVREPSRGLRFFEDDQSEGGRLGKLWRREDMYV